MRIFSILFIGLFVSCSTITRDKSISLNFISDFNMNSETVFDNIKFGGLSGIFYNKRDNFLYAISDDRSYFGHARLYKLSVSFNPFEIKYHSTIFLKDEKNKFFITDSIDFEGIAFLPTGNIILSTESVKLNGKSSPPRIMEFSSKGNLVKYWATPDRYKQRDSWGVIDNKSFESLVFESSKVYTAVEGPLIQDGLESTKVTGGVVRILEYGKGLNSYSPCKEYAYHLDPISSEAKSSSADIGLVELLKLNDGFLFLERSYLPSLRKNEIKLYFDDDNKNIINFESLKNKSIANSKRLVLNFDKIVAKLSTGNQKLDNIEGMSWGPLLKNGNKTIIFVSDNNFNVRQRTLFLVFEVVN